MRSLLILSAGDWRQTKRNPSRPRLAFNRSSFGMQHGNTVAGMTAEEQNFRQGKCGSNLSIHPCQDKGCNRCPNGQNNQAMWNRTRDGTRSCRRDEKPLRRSSIGGEERPTRDRGPGVRMKFSGVQRLLFFASRLPGLGFLFGRLGSRVGSCAVFRRRFGGMRLGFGRRMGFSVRFGFGSRMRFRVRFGPRRNMGFVFGRRMRLGTRLRVRFGF